MRLPWKASRFAGPAPAHDDGQRGIHRYRRAFLSSGALALARGASLVSVLVLVPVLLHYLDDERFGLWMAFGSITALLSFADFGLGHGLMTTIASASGVAGHAKVRHLVSNGLAAIVGLTLPLLALVFLVGFLCPWNRWLGTTSVPDDELRLSVMILALGLLLGGALGIAGRIQAGLQTWYIASLWAAAATLATLLALMLGVRLALPFPALVAISVGVPAVFALVNTIWYFGYHSPALRPAVTEIERDTIVGLFRTGLLFFVLQVAASLAFFTDNLMLAAVLGAEAVPGYAVPARLFGYISLAVAIVVQPLWPAYAEALARGDVRWIKTAFVRSLVLALSLSIVASGVLFLLHDRIFPLWTRGQLHADPRVVAALALWSVIDSCAIALAMLLNGLNVIRLQVIVAVVMVVASFPVRYLLLVRLGAWGLPLATSIVYLVTAMVPCLVAVPGILRDRTKSPGATSAQESIGRVE